MENGQGRSANVARQATILLATPTFAAKVMAQQKAPLLWALLLTACLMNSGRAFVLHQPALMRTRSTYRVAGSSSLSGSCGTDRGACSISWEERGKRMRREHRMKMDTATGGEFAAAKSIFSQERRGTARCPRRLPFGFPAAVTASAGNRLERRPLSIIPSPGRGEGGTCFTVDDGGGALPWSEPATATTMSLE